MMLLLVQTQSLLVISNETALTATPLLVNTENVSSKILFTGYSALAKGAEEWLLVSVEVTLKELVFYSPPGTVHASEEFLFLLLHIAGTGR